MSLRTQLYDSSMLSGKRKMQGLRLLSSVSLSTLILLCSSSASAEVELGQTVGDFSVLDRHNRELVVTSSPERAAIAILFLSARSDAVDKSLESISRLYRKHRRLGVVYIGVCSNGVETPDELEEFARKRGLIFTIYRDPTAMLAGKLGIATAPAVALVDAAGRLVHRGGLDSFAGRLAFDAAVTDTVTPRGDEDVISPTPIAEPGDKRDTADLYGVLSFSSELVFEQIPGAAVYHCSTITQAANGDLLCLWYGGSYESADDQTLFLARRLPREREWQTPQALIEGPEPLPGNGVIFVDGHERVWIVWCRMENARPLGRGQGWDNCRLMSRVFTDHGMTWSEDTEFLDAKLPGRAAQSACASCLRRSGLAAGSHRGRGGRFGLSDRHRWRTELAAGGLYSRRKSTGGDRAERQLVVCADAAGAAVDTNRIARWW